MAEKQRRVFVSEPGAPTEPASLLPPREREACGATDLHVVLYQGDERGALRLRERRRLERRRLERRRVRSPVEAEACRAARVAGTASRGSTGQGWLVVLGAIQTEFGSIEQRGSAPLIGGKRRCILVFMDVKKMDTADSEH
jgi:hypothetical protein